MTRTTLIPRVVALLLLPLGVALFMMLAQATEAHAASLEEGRTAMTAPAPVADSRIAQGGVISTIQSVINYVINATVFFPARTFQEAIEKATRNIFSEQLDEFRAPLEQVVAVYAFQNGAVFGSLAIPGEVNAIGARLTEAAVPIWALSLVLIGLGVLTRNAVGVGNGMVDVAAELARWLFIALASGNAIAIVNLVHTGFGALTYAIASEGGTVTAGQFVAAFIPDEATLGVWPILLLVVGCVLGLIVILVLSATYIARYVMLLAITGLAPICIACEGISFTRFVFRDWLSMFLRLEFLQIINIAVLIVFKAMALGATGSGVAQALLKLAIMIGLASAIIGINLSIFKQVFGVAIDVVAQMRQAAEQIVRVIGVAIGAAVTGGAAVPALASAAGSTAAASSAQPSGASSGESAASSDANYAAATGASGRAAWALSGALGGTVGSFMRGYGDGAFVSSDFNARRANASRAEDMQRASDTRRAEALAREMGATNSDDIEAIAKSVTEPEQGRTSDEMMRAHRDNAPALREMAQQYGGPARAAAVGGYGSFGEMAVAMAHERMAERDSSASAQAPQRGEPVAMSNAPGVASTLPQTAVAAESLTPSHAASPSSSGAPPAATHPPEISNGLASSAPPVPEPAHAGASPMSNGLRMDPAPVEMASVNGNPPAMNGASSALPSDLIQPTPSMPAMPANAFTPPADGPPLPRDTSLADWAAQVPLAPIRDWIHTPPHIGSPGEQSMLPYDFGMGAMLARATESSPTHAPLWAQTAYSLRMAYGESYVTNLMQEAQGAQWSEAELMARVERHVEATPSPRVVSLFWKPGGAPTQPSGQRGK